MKTTLISILICLSVFLVFSAKNISINKGTHSLCNEYTIKFSDKYSGIPLGLTVECIREPFNTQINDKTPEFGWIVPKVAVSQKAYQILVSTSKKKSERNIGDMWDSGQIKSNKSTAVEYDGAPVSQNTSYFWKVRIVDNNDRLSEYSAVQEFKTGDLEKERTSQNYFQIEKKEPAAYKKNEGGSYFIDYGKAAFGTLELNYKPQKTETLTIRLGEKLRDGRIDRKPGGTIRFQEIQLKVNTQKNNYQIELPADKRNTSSVVSLPDSFPVVMPFRYAEIEGAGDGFNPKQLVQLAYFNYFDDNASSFTSSDDVLNQVWDLCKYSIKATTFAGVYVDGDRERIPYEADAYLNQLSHYSVDNEYSMARKTIEYFMEYPTWPTEWQLHVALMFYQDYMYTGNTELIEKYYEQLKHKTLVALVDDNDLVTTSSPNHNDKLMQQLGFADTNLRLHDIVDWPKKGGFGGVMGETDDFEYKPFNTVVNSFYYRNMVIMNQFATLLNKPGDARAFELRAEKARKAINSLMWSEEEGYYVDGIGSVHGALHSNMLPLAFGIVPKNRLESVTEHVKSRGMACSVYGSQYLMEALYNANEADYALELMTAMHDRSWYNMIKVGSSITMEAWDMKYKPNSDWNHAWGAAPANIIPRCLWGIQPKTPGFGVVSIKPQMSKLGNSTITYPTIMGQIRGEYKKLNNKTVQYVFKLPANMLGELNLKLSRKDEVTFNGEKISIQSGIVRLRSGVNNIDIKVNSF